MLAGLDDCLRAKQGPVPCSPQREDRMTCQIFRLRAIFVMLTAVSLFALVLEAAAASKRIKFGASSQWKGRSIELTGRLYRPSGMAKVPVVILMHGCSGLRFGVTASLHAHANTLNRNGFAALILDSFGPRGVAGGWVCKGLDRLADARIYRLRDAKDAARWLKSQPDIDARNVFLMGQSNGGSVALRAAAAGGFRAVAAYYPWCGAASGNRIPLIVFGGGRDDWVPPDKCGRRPQSAKYNFVLYPDAAHSFDVRSLVKIYLGHRIGYDAAATADSRRRMIAFFRKHMR